MKYRICFSLLFAPLSAGLVSTEEDFSSKIVSFLLVKDFEGARVSCETAIKIFPESHKLKALYIRSLAEAGRCDAALEVFKKERMDRGLAENFDLLESLSWGILLQKEKESEMGILASLIGAYLTHDARAVDLIMDGLQTSNAFIRSIAIQLATNYNDRVLQKEMMRLLKEEKNWYVRKDVLSAVGRMRIKEAKYDLKEIVASKAVTSEEKGVAIQSLVMMHDDISVKELDELVTSKRAGLRELAIVFVEHFHKDLCISRILPLINDSSPSVRVRMLAFLGSYPLSADHYSVIEKDLRKLADDLNPEISVLSYWALLKIDADMARKGLKKWVDSTNAKTARFAATVIGAGGMETLPMLEQCYHEAQDQYVKINLAFSMLKQGVKAEQAGLTLRNFLLDEKGKIMFSEGLYPCFAQILPSEVRHAPNVTRYPEMVDQLSRLKILNALAIAEVPDLKEIARKYLQGQIWGVVGSAAVFFLEEGEMASIDLVRELLDDPDQTVRVQAALALAFYGGEKKAASVLQEAYEKVDWDKKISILEAIGHVGSRESIEFLLKVLEEPFTLPRTIAASSIIQCLYH